MTGWEIVIEIASWIAILGGSIFLCIGSLGMLRFPEFWARLHAASVADSAGMLLLLLGMCLQAGLTLITVKLIFIGIFLFITGPTSTHAVANAALAAGSRPVSDVEPEGTETGGAHPHGAKLDRDADRNAEPHADQGADRNGQGRGHRGDRMPDPEVTP